MRRINFSKKTLKGLSARLKFLIQKGADKRSVEFRILGSRIKFFIERFRFSRRQTRRAFGTAAVVLGLGVASMNDANAQAAYAASINNPFGLTANAANSAGAPVEVDLDNDGDLDLIVSDNTGSFKYYQNTGTATAPAFAAPVTNPFGLALTANPTYYVQLAIVDLDNDGDFDILSSEYVTNSYTSNAVYYQNTGTATVPAFAAPVINPFGISSGIYFKAPELVDLDNDGDYDLLTTEYNISSYTSSISYQQNIGTATAPNFAAAQASPFGLNFPSSLFFGQLTTGDLDNDGDMDVLFGEGNNNPSADFLYFQNTGTSTSPAFASPVTNPFGLVGTNTSSSPRRNAPTFLDLDGDGDLDILSGERGGNLVYFENILSTSGPISINSIVINTPSCSPGGDGMVNAIASGGSGTIWYKIGVDSNTTGVFNNYSAGSYTLRVRDSLNVFADSNITINSSVPPVLSLTSTNITCNGMNNGTVSLSGTGGALPYIYQLLPGFGPSPTASTYASLGPNTYTAYLTDSKNCTDSVTVTIIEPAAIVVTQDSILQPSCNGSTDGEIHTTPSGGVGNFTTNLFPALGVPAGLGNYTGLGANSYSILTTDANMCTRFDTIVLVDPAAILLTVPSIQDASSATATDGSFTISGSGGSGSITYSIAPAGGTQSPPGTFTNLAANTYTVTATDANNCTNTSSVTINFATAVNDLEKHNIKIYPNPASDVINIESAQKVNSLTVIEITGKAIKTVQEPGEQVSLANLPKGIYILKLHLKNEETAFARITKQ